MKKQQTNKYLLHYLATVNGSNVQLWEKINTTKGPCYKNALTLLRRKLHSIEQLKTVHVIKVLHLYTINV